MLPLILFYCFALVVVGAALGVIVSRNPAPGDPSIGGGVPTLGSTP